MPLGSSSAAPVTMPGPSLRKKIVKREKSELLADADRFRVAARVTGFFAISGEAIQAFLKSQTCGAAGAQLGAEQEVAEVHRVLAVAERHRLGRSLEHQARDVLTLRQQVHDVPGSQREYAHPLFATAFLSCNLVGADVKD